MKKKDIRKILRNYLSDLSGNEKSEFIFIRDKKIVDELCIKIINKFENEEQIEEYLDFVVNSIKGLNEFFAKKKRAKISYTRLFSFANKDDRISEFFVNKEISSRKEEKENEKDIAGFSLEQSNEEEILEMSSLKVGVNNFVYRFLWTEHGVMVFFSPEKREIVVQLLSGKIMTFSSYKKNFKKDNSISYKFIGKMYLFRKISEFSKKTDVMHAFLIYIRQERAKIARRKFKKRSFDS